MKYRIEVTARAEADIEEAYAWYAERSPEGAAKWHGELSRAINTLERFPERCPVALLESEAVGLDIRRLVVGRYNVFLHVDGGTVYVLTVRHGARKRLSKEDLSDRRAEQLPALLKRSDMRLLAGEEATSEPLERALASLQSSGLASSGESVGAFGDCSIERRTE